MMMRTEIKRLEFLRGFSIYYLGELMENVDPEDKLFIKAAVFLSVFLLNT